MSASAIFTSFSLTFALAPTGCAAGPSAHLLLLVFFFPGSLLNRHAQMDLRAFALKGFLESGAGHTSSSPEAPLV